MATASLPGCASSPPPTLSTEDLRSSVRLSARLLDASDTASSAFERVVNNALMAEAPPRELYSYMLTRAEATSNIRALALGADPAGALVDLYVYATLAVWACDNRVHAHPELALTPCEPTFGVLLHEIEAIAREYMAPDKLARVDRAIGEWKAAHPNRMVIGLIRLSDLHESTGTAPVILGQVAPSMFSPVTEAAQQLQEARLLGYQALWLANRLPMAASWQLDASIYGAMASAPAARALDSVDSLSKGISTAHQAFATLAESNSALASRAAELGTRVETLEKAVSELGDDLGGNLSGVSSSLGTLGTEVRDLDGAEELASRVVREATISGAALIALAATSLGLVLWSHRHHSRRASSKSS